MTTQTEAMKQALEASKDLCTEFALAKVQEILSKAIEQAKEQEPIDTPLPCDIKVGHVTIRKGVALSVLVARMQVLYDMAQATHAQPTQPEAEKQEPVAMQMDVIVGNLVREGINKHRARELAEHFIKHTSPPQHSAIARKPLTNEEIMNIAKVSCIGISPHEDTLNFAKVIEAVHGIKEQNT